MRIKKNLILQEIQKRFGLIEEKRVDPKSKKGSAFWEGRGRALWEFSVWLEKDRLDTKTLKKYLYKKHLKEKARLARATKAKGGDPFIGGKTMEFGDLLNWIKQKKLGSDKGG